MGDFAINLAISYEIGAARDDRSILSGMDISPDEFFANFGQGINDLILCHRKALEAKRELETHLFVRRSTPGPKSRWVDGTPEYSLHVCGLRKLFPEALFVHLVRDVDPVVRSLLNFHHVSGRHLVVTEEEAYKYWLRRVKACLKAEQAYGPRVIRRLLYSSLVEDPESTIRSLLDFVGDPYSPKCLEPLAERINSSNVPPDFKSDDPATDPAIVEEARRLFAEIEQTAQPSKASRATADEMEAAFQASCLKAKTFEQELKDQIASQQKHYTAEIEGYKSQIEKQQQHYTAEIVGYKSQIATQQQHHLAETDEYKSQIANQQRHYLAEIEQYKSQIASQEQQHTTEVEAYKSNIVRQQQHYLTEIEAYKSQIASQEQHYTAEMEAYKLQLANQEQHYTDEVYRRLREIRNLASLLDQFAELTTKLRSSRFWRVANKAARIEAKLFHGKAPVPDQKFDKILARYSRWRGSHPEIVKLDRATEATGSAVLPNNSGAKLDNLSGMQSIDNDCADASAGCRKTAIDKTVTT
jgi:hypothetical protein